MTLPSVDPAFLEDTKSSRLYKDGLTDLQLPRIQLKLPLLPWDLVWKRLAAPLLPPLEVDLFKTSSSQWSADTGLGMPLPQPVLTALPQWRTASTSSQLVQG
ncbi:MAG: hypothetical protein ACK56I_18660, partial [bacterium]